MIGFTFRGKHCYNDFGIMCRSYRVMLPTKRKRQTSIPLRDGVIDFGDDSYDNRPITVDCNVKSESIQQLRERTRHIAAWLSESGPLEFDDDPGIVYQAGVWSSIDLEQSLINGKFTIVFECEPFATGATHDYTQQVTKIGDVINIPYEGTRKTPCIIRIENTGSTTLSSLELDIYKE